MSILYLETLEKFEYLIESLKPNSEKLVVWQCENCLLLKDKKYRIAKLNKLCLLCSNKINAHTNKDVRIQNMKKYWEEHGHSRAGKEHTEESKKKMSESSKGKITSEETKKKLSIALSGKSNPFWGKRHSKESLEKMSESQKKIARRGKDSNFYGRQYHGKGQWYNGVWMRSSWEVKFAKYLDINNIPWTYEPKRFPIKYIYNQQEMEGTYCPDFYIGEDYYVEIKGYWRDDSREKFEAFKDTYKDIKIILYEKEQLKQLGII